MFRKLSTSLIPLISATFGWTWTCTLGGQSLPRKSSVFRIHRSENGEVVFTISGRIDAEHIAELETLIGAEEKGRRIILDLKDMTLTGQAGIDFLTRCEESDITVVNCDPYVREWITRQQSGK
jgi:anti-anti-sigma regulatory factor